MSFSYDWNTISRMPSFLTNIHDHNYKYMFTYVNSFWKKMSGITIIIITLLQYPYYFLYNVYYINIVYVFVRCQGRFERKHWCTVDANNSTMLFLAAANSWMGLRLVQHLPVLLLNKYLKKLWKILSKQTLTRIGFHTVIPVYRTF